MKALVFEDVGKLVLRDIPKPRITHDDDVLIEVKATGICGTDLHIVAGRFPARRGIALGHESTGVVLEVGPAVTGVKPGDRVIIDPTFYCGECRYCRTNRPNYCERKSSTETGVSADGTFAEYHVLRSRFVYALPEELDFDEGTLAEPLACVLTALRNSRIRPESRVLVAGAGPIGMLSALAAQAQGCDVTLGEVNPFRLEHGAALLGAGSPRGRMSDLASGAEFDRLAREPFDLVIDTTGSLVQRLLPLVDAGGDLLAIGFDHTAEARIAPAQLTARGIRLVGSVDSFGTFASAIELLRRVPALTKIITHSFSMELYPEAFALLGRDARATKIVLHPGSDA